jgi:hypothetical protein
MSAETTKTGSEPASTDAATGSKWATPPVVSVAQLMRLTVPKERQ